ncbi:MAG: neutral zinc metallopeptidase, partial [Actinobacteria bacterium]|nr:neutral zinc metallopeptidase [Actinomycetota bacterium]
MRWKRGRGGGMIEDRRGQGGGLGGFGGFGSGGFSLPGGKAGGISGVVMLVLVVIALFSSGILGGSNGSGSGGTSLRGAPDPNDDLGQFVGFVVEDVQTEWQRLFREDGRTYQVTKLVLFDGSTQSGCGLADASTGPFYCPADRKVYLDLSFFQELHDRFGAPGDFAQAYVIAHEFGHHVQTLFGTEARVREEQRRRPAEENELSVRLELQADCYAGVWAKTAYEENLLEGGDLQEGLDAAAAVGDDRIQRSAGQRVNQESWTHGSSAQRMQWFQ